MNRDLVALLVVAALFSSAMNLLLAWKMRRCGCRNDRGRLDHE